MGNAKRIIVGLLCIGSFYSHAQDRSIHEIRHEFYLSTLDYQHAFPLIDKLSGIGDPNALELAYMAATQAILAKPGWNIFKKIGYLRQSRDTFQKAIKRDMKDLEIRFLRLSIEHHIPRYLGLSRHIAYDKQVIMENIEKFKEKELPQEISDYIILFSVESGIYTTEEIEHLRYLLENR